MKHSTPLIVLAFIVLSACTPREKGGTEPARPIFSMPRQTAEPDTGSIISATVWQRVPAMKSFCAPWTDDLQDETQFQCYLSPHYMYFRFQVPDQTLTLKEPFREKLDVCPEDRAEIFLSATPGMDIYYCMEMDPRGRTLDYVASFYRQYDYEWSFATLQTETQISADGYIVAGRLSTAEMLQLGIPLDVFYMGIFRADFDGPQNVVWYSLLRVEREQADFHIPEMLYRVEVETPRTTAP